MFNLEIKLSQFADDMCSFVSDGKSIKCLFETCDDFRQLSGLTCNKDKSQILWLGPWKLKIAVPCGALVCRDSCHALGTAISKTA